MAGDHDSSPKHSDTDDPPPQDVEDSRVEEHVPEAHEHEPKLSHKLIGWGAVAAVLSAVLAMTANLSELFGWFAPDETRALVEQTQETMADTESKVDELVTLLRNQAAASGIDLNIESEAAIRNAVEAIAVSGNRQKQNALVLLDGGDVKAAAEMLEQLASSQTKAASATSEVAAQSWREAGALWDTLDIARAVRSYEEANRLKPDDPELLDLLGHALIRAGRVDDAVARFQEARQLGPEPGVFSSLNLGLGIVAKQRGDYAEAEHHFTTALETAEQAEVIDEIINSLNTLGGLRRAQGDLDAALDLQQRVLALAESTDNLHAKAIALEELGAIAAIREDFTEAERLLQQAHDIHQSRGDLARQAAASGNLGALALSRGDIDAAEPILLESVRIGELLGWQSSIAHDLVNLAGISMNRENYVLAVERLDHAQKIAEDAGIAELEPIIIFNRAEVANAADDMVTACRYWLESLPMLVTMGSGYADYAEEQIAAAGCRETDSLD